MFLKCFIVLIMGTETDEINRKLQIASRKHYVNREAEREREREGREERVN